MNKILTIKNSRATESALKEIRNLHMPTVKLQMNVPETLKRRFKKACQQQEIEMTTVTIELIESWLKDNE